eukprot:9053088-Pyramimonas_sp.AAC.1
MGTCVRATSACADIPPTLHSAPPTTHTLTIRRPTARSTPARAQHGHMVSVKNPRSNCILE